MTEEEAVEAALKTVDRNDDGSVDMKALIDEVAALLDFDEAAERRNKAVRAVGRRRKPGATTPEGVMCLPGLDPYGYEPRRLVADNEGHLVEQEKARPHHKQAEAERAREGARRQASWADRKTAESEKYAAWAIEQLQAGRRAAEITFDAFVRESGIWSPGTAEVEQPGLDDAA